MDSEHKYEGQERRTAITTRRIATTEQGIIVAVLEERLHNIKEENRRDHEMIMNKLNETSKVQLQIIDIQVQITKIISGNTWRDWAIRLIYAGGIVGLIAEIIRARLKG